MTPYIQHEPTSMKGRGGVRSTTVYMDVNKKTKLVKSVYGNHKRLTIAQFILLHDRCTSEQIIATTKYKKETVSQIISEMRRHGVLIMEKSVADKRKIHLSITELGRRLLSL